MQRVLLSMHTQVSDGRPREYLTDSYLKPAGREQAIVQGSNEWKSILT